MRLVALCLLVLIAPAPAAGAAEGVAYADSIRAISSRHGVDAGLLRAVIRAESAFDPQAVSPRGARGLMQLMPATASRLGVRDAFDAVANLDGGARHLRYLLDRYAGDVALALAAYNAGEAAVDLYGGVPPYPETRAYVRRVLDWAGRAREGTGTRPALYRYERPDGTLVYSNLPPRGAAPALTPRRP